MLVSKTGLDDCMVLVRFMPSRENCEKIELRTLIIYIAEKHDDLELIAEKRRFEKVLEKKHGDSDGE